MIFRETFFFGAAELIGTLAFAASGAMLAIDRHLDLLGVIVLGVTTALGGGVIRDVLLGILPPRMFSSYAYIAAAAAASIIVFAVEAILQDRFLRKRETVERVINLFDAIGLGVFTVIGIQASVEHGFGQNAFLSLFLGVLTGVGGGVLRDVMSREIPAVLRKHIYAIASVAGGVFYYLCWYFGWSGSCPVFLSVLIVVAIRLAAAHYRWSLPKMTA